MIDYQSKSEDEDPPPSDWVGRVHDVYLPAGLLILGFLAILTWVVSRGRWGTGASVFIFTIASMFVLTAAAIMCLAAWILTRILGGSFGNPITTILKITALVVFIESVFPWLMVGMTKAGMISASGKGPPLAVVLEILVPAFIALLIARYIYGLGDDEAQFFGWVVAIGICVVDLVLLLAMAVGLHLLIAAKARTTAAAGARSTTNISAATNSAGTSIATTSADRRIVQRISQGTPFVLEGREWKRNHIWTDRNKSMRRLIGELYAAGALKVYVDMMADKLARPMSGHRTFKIYVELPTEGPHRIACVMIARAYHDKNGSVTASPSVFITGRFLTIELQW